MQKPQEQRSIFDFNEMQNPRRPIQSGAVPQFVEQRPKNVEQLPKKWNRSCKRVSVQQIVEQKAKLNILNFLGLYNQAKILVNSFQTRYMILNA